eukprot:1804316-Prymnesium_polylepis.1
MASSSLVFAANSDSAVAGALAVSSAPARTSQHRAEKASTSLGQRCGLYAAAEWYPHVSFTDFVGCFDRSPKSFSEMAKLSRRWRASVRMCRPLRLSGMR